MREENPHPSKTGLGGAPDLRLDMVGWATRPTEHFQLRVSGRPLRFDLHRTTWHEQKQHPSGVECSDDPRLAQPKGEPGALGLGGHSATLLAQMGIDPYIQHIGSEARMW